MNNSDYLFADTGQRVEAIRDQREHSRFVNLFIHGLADGMHVQRFDVHNGNVKRGSMSIMEQRRKSIQNDVKAVANSAIGAGGLTTAQRIATCRRVVGRDNGLYLQTGVMLMWASDEDNHPGADADHRNALFPASLGTANSSLWSRNMVTVVAQNLEQQTRARVEAVRSALRHRAFVIAQLLTLESVRNLVSDEQTKTMLTGDASVNFSYLWTQALAEERQASKTFEALGEVTDALNGLFEKGAMRAAVEHQNAMIRGPCDETQSAVHTQLLTSYGVYSAAVASGLADCIKSLPDMQNQEDDNAGWLALLNFQQDASDDDFPDALSSLLTPVTDETLSTLLNAIVNTFRSLKRLRADNENFYDNTTTEQIETAFKSFQSDSMPTVYAYLRRKNSVLAESDAYDMCKELSRAIVDKPLQLNIDASADTSTVQILTAVNTAFTNSNGLLNPANKDATKNVRLIYFGLERPPPIFGQYLAAKAEAIEQIMTNGVATTLSSRSSLALLKQTGADAPVSSFSDYAVDRDKIAAAVGSSIDCYDDGTLQSDKLATVAACFHGLFTKDDHFKNVQFPTMSDPLSNVPRPRDLTELATVHPVANSILESSDDEESHARSEYAADAYTSYKAVFAQVQTQARNDLPDNAELKRVAWTPLEDRANRADGAVARVALCGATLQALETLPGTPRGTADARASLQLLQLFATSRVGRELGTSNTTAYSTRAATAQSLWASPYKNNVADIIRPIFTGIAKYPTFAGTLSPLEKENPFGINNTYIPVNLAEPAAPAAPAAAAQKNADDFATSARDLYSQCPPLADMTTASLQNLLVTTKRLLRASRRLHDEMRAVERIYNSTVSADSGTHTQLTTTMDNGGGGGDSILGGRPISDSEARERRMSVWADAMRELSIAGDPLYAFVRQMAGEMHDDIHAIVRLEDRGMDLATKQRREQRREMLRVEMNFQNRVMETLLGAVLKDTKLRLDVQDPSSSAGQIANRTVVVNAETLSRLDELKAGQSGLPFFQANQELERTLEKIKDQPMTLSALLEDVRSMLQKSTGQRLRMEDQGVGEQGAASMDYLMQPRVSYVIRMTNQSFAAIRDAYDIFVREWQNTLGGRRPPSAYALIEGGNHMLTNDFARLAAYCMARSRMNASNSSAYLSLSAAKANVVQLRMQLKRLVNTAAGATVLDWSTGGGSGGGGGYEMPASEWWKVQSGYYNRVL